jgi:hypothetical protein
MAKRKRKVETVDYVRPTPERAAKNRDRSAGMATQLVPVIDELLEAHLITEREWMALAYYRDQASRAEDDCAQEGTLAPSRIMVGGGGGYGAKTPAILLGTPAILETARIERDMGPLRDIARAVAVDDWTLTRWCIEKHGGRERYNSKGQFIAMVPNNQSRAEQEARLELRFAAARIIR